MLFIDSDRGYPYLYEGTVNEEDAYITWFSKLPHSAIAVAYVGEKPVGFVSSTNFTAFSEHFKGSLNLFKKAQLNSSAYYYISDVLILPAYRGNGLSKRLFAALESYAQDSGYTSACFVTESHDGHPLKPKDYRSLDPLWQQLGYKKSPLSVKFSWPTIQPNNKVLDQQHKLDYWLKAFK